MTTINAIERNLFYSELLKEFDVKVKFYEKTEDYPDHDKIDNFNKEVPLLDILFDRTRYSDAMDRYCEEINYVVNINTPGCILIVYDRRSFYKSVRISDYSGMVRLNPAGSLENKAVIKRGAYR